MLHKDNSLGMPLHSSQIRMIHWILTHLTVFLLNLTLMDAKETLVIMITKPGSDYTANICHFDIHIAWNGDTFYVLHVLS